MGLCFRLTFAPPSGCFRCCCKPQAALVECKADGKDVEPGSQQEREIRRFVDSGWPVYVVNSHADVDEMIEDVLGA